MPFEQMCIRDSFKPLAENRLDRPEINNPTERIELFGLAGEMKHISVAMQIAALAFVADNAVATMDLVLAGDLVGH